MPSRRQVEQPSASIEEGCRKEDVFRDERLELLVRKALGKLDGPITAEDLAGVTQLSNQRGERSIAGITDLSGLRCLSSLESLILIGTGLVDIRELSLLRKLKSLDLSENRISDVSPLGGMAGLESLVLDGNPIARMEPLYELRKLRALSLNRTEIAEVAWLGGLADLKDLHLDRNRIEDLGFLPSLGRLERLSLDYNEITSLEPFAHSTARLVHLSLRHNRIRDVSALTGVEGRHLVLYENDIRCQDSREDLVAISRRWDEIGIDCEEFNTEP